MQKEIMTPDHPKWEEFMYRMYGPEGCDFREEYPGGLRGGVLWNCAGDASPDKFIGARRILNSIPGIDVEGSLEMFGSHGGHCDCEIIRNVECDYRLSEVDAGRGGSKQ